jgi:hypothetical protein
MIVLAPFARTRINHRRSDFRDILGTRSIWMLVLGILIPVLLAPLVEAQGISPGSRRDRSARLSPDVKHAARSITSREAMEHVRWLADDLREGRLAGTVGCRDSADYIARKFEEIGVLPAGDDGTWFHNFIIPGRVGLRGAVEKGNRIKLLVSEKATHEVVLKFREEFLPHPRCPDAEISSLCTFMLEPLQYIGDLERDPVKDRLVILAVDEPISQEVLEATCKDIHERGGSGLLLIGEACRPAASEVWPPKDATELLPIPVIRIHGEGIAKIWKISGRPLRSWKRQSADDGAIIMGKPRVTMEVNRDGRDLSLGRNVVGRLLGTDPDLRHESIVIGAHYDHVGRGRSPGLSLGGEPGEIHNGADDNASGVAALLELAEAYALNRLRTKRSILFVAFDAEELGMHGSNAFVADSGFKPAEMAAMVNMDMISRNARRVVKVGRRASDEDLGKIIYEMAKLLELQIDETGMDAVLNRSDQAPFLRAGVPSVFFFGGFHEDYHTPFDDVEDLVPGKLQNIARLAFLTSWGLSQLPPRDDDASESAGSDD